MSFSEKDSLISKEKALDHAITRLIIGVITKTPKLDKWRGATVDPEPLEIYDINGTLLFYEFSVIKDGKIVGRIKASASKVLGPAVYTMEIGPRKWSVEKAIEIAKKVIVEKYQEVEILSTQIVCYSYPKIGILFKLGDPKTKEETGSIVMDVVTNVVIPRIAPKEEGFKSVMWSFYKSILQKDRPDKMVRWEDDDHSVDELKNIARETDIDIRARLSDMDIERLGEKMIWDLKKKLTDLNYAVAQHVFVLPHKMIPLTLYGQEHQCWCAVATGQMILKYHHYYYEQPDIAVEMATIPQPQNIATWNPGPPDFDPCGSTYNGMQAGIESLSRNYLDTVVATPTWADIVSEIDENGPLYSIIPGHARTCSGYRNLAFLFRNRLLGVEYKSLYICDPWPPNANNDFCNPLGGAEYWEDWDVSNYWDFIYIHPCKGTMDCQTD